MKPPAPRRLAITVCAALLAVAAAFFAARAWTVQRHLTLCSRCGRVVVLQSSGWGDELSPMTPGLWPREVQDTELTALFAGDKSCTHGAVMVFDMAGGRVIGPERGDFLVPMEGYATDAFGRTTGHYTGIGLFTLQVFLPSMHIQKPFDAGWKNRFNGFLRERARGDRQFAGALRDSLQTTVPAAGMVKTLVADFQRRADGLTSAPGTAGGQTGNVRPDMETAR